VSVDIVEVEDLGGRTRVRTRPLFHLPEERDGMLEAGMEVGLQEWYDRLDEVLERLGNPCHGCPRLARSPPGSAHSWPGTGTPTARHLWRGTGAGPLEPGSAAAERRLLFRDWPRVVDENRTPAARSPRSAQGGVIARRCDTSGPRCLRARASR
jgi:hypothetical protein